MAITLTEIESTLRLKDELTKGMADAASAVRASGVAMGDAMGASASETSKAATTMVRSIGQVDTELRAAKKEVENLRVFIDAKTGRQPFLDQLVKDLDVALPRVKALEAEMRSLVNPPKSKPIPLPDLPSPQVDKFTQVIGKANSALGVLGVGLSAAAAIGFAKSLLEDGDALVKMGAQTGITIDRLLQFRAAGADVNVGLESITSAVSTMNVRLGQETEKVANGLGRIGLSIDDVKSRTPENAFAMIADAISKIPDPLRQAAAANEIFGGQASTILPLLKKGFDDVGDSVVGMNADIVQATADANSAIGKFWQTVKDGAAVGLVEIGRWVAAGLLPATKQMNDMRREALALRDQLASMAGQAATSGDAAKYLGKGQMAPLQVPTASEAETAMRRLDEETKKLAATQKKQAEEALKAAEAQRKWNVEMYLASTGQKDLGAAIMAGTLDIEAASGFIERAATDMGDLQRQVGQFGTTEWAPGFVLDATNAAQSVEQLRRNGQFSAAALKEMGVAAGALMPILTGLGREADVAGKSFAERLGSGMVDILKGVPDLIVSALTGGGGLRGALSAIGSQMGSLFGRELGEKIGKSLGGTLGTLAGPIGAALGGLVGPLIDKVFGMFGPSRQEKEGRAAFADFEGQFKSFEDMVNSIGSAYEATGRTAEQARQDVERLMAAERQGGDAVRVMTAEIQAAFDAAENRSALLSEASSIFGPSQADMQASADKARQMFDAMLASGLFTQRQLDAAYREFQQTLADIGDTAAQAWLAANGGVTDFALAARDAGYATTEELQKAADQSRQLAEYMRDSGMFTAAAVEDAFKKADAAALSALGVSDELVKKRDELAKSIEAEAPEEVMGVIEAQIRGQIAALDAQMAAASSSTADSVRDSFRTAGDGVGTSMDEAAASVKDAMTESARNSAAAFSEAANSMRDNLSTSGDEAARAVQSALDAIRAPSLTIRVDLDTSSWPSTFTPPAPPAIPQAEGGDWWVTRPTLFLAGEKGPERATFTPQGTARPALPGAFLGGQRDDRSVEAIHALKTALLGQMRDQPTLIAIAIKDAIRQAPRGR